MRRLRTASRPAAWPLLMLSLLVALGPRLVDLPRSRLSK